MKIFYILPALLLCLTPLGLVSCSDDEVAFGAGAIVGAVVSDSLGDRHREHRCRRCYDEQTLSVDPSLQGAAYEGPSTNQETAKVAQKYDIPANSAQTLLDSLHKAQKKDFSQLTAMGVSANELALIAENKDLPPASITIMSARLGLDQDETLNLVDNIKSDYQAYHATAQPMPVRAQ